MRNISLLPNQMIPHSKFPAMCRNIGSKPVDLPQPIHINGNSNKDSANFYGSAGSGSVNMHARHDAENKYTYFSGTFGRGFSNYDIKSRDGGYYIWGNHSDKNVSSDVSANQDGKLVSFWARAGNKQYNLRFSHYGNNRKTLSGTVSEDFGRTDFVNIDISQSKEQLIISGTAGRNPVSLYLDFNESEDDLVSKEYKTQLEIGAIQMLL